MQQKPSFLPNLAVKRPITITVTLVAIIVVGAIAYFKIPVELLPSGFNPPFLGVWVSYPNANPQEVEEQIARPVEEQVRTINGVTKVETYSNQNGCWTWLEFASGTDMDLAYDQLRDRMERVRPELPEDVDRYFLRRFGRNDTPVIFLSIAFRNGVDDPYYIADHFIKRPIERMDGVASVDIWGAEEKSIQILIDQNKVKAHQLNMYQVINDLRSDNFALSSGWVYEGGKKFIVRSVARFKNIEEIRKLPINRKGLTVGDIADVRYDVQERNWTQRVNGGPGLMIEISKESLANSVALSHHLKEVLQRDILTHPILKDTDINLLFVQGEYIEDSIDNLRDTAIWGGFFAVLILLFFLKNLRMTIIMMLAIPLSVLISLTVVYFMGWTLNIILMMGLMISVGMVVDNGIVVLENIYRLRNQGKDTRTASILGTSEVNLAIIMATLTTIAVFVPILLVDDGNGGFKFYMQRIGLPVIFALAGSLFVALVLIPLATSRLAGQQIPKENRLIVLAKRVYQKALVTVLNHRMDTVLAVIAIMALTGAIVGNLQQSDSMEGNISDLRLMFELPGHFTTEEASAFFKEVEDTVTSKADVYGVRAYDTGFRKGFGRVRVYLDPPEKEQWYNVIYRGTMSLFGVHVNRKMTRDEVLEDLKNRVPSKPGIKFRTSWRGAATGAEEGTVSLMLYGDDTGKLNELAEEVERRMRLLEGVVSVETDKEDGADEIKITMDRQMVTRNGINPNQVAFTLMYAVRGINLSRFQAQDKEIEMHVQFREEDRENLLQLKNMTFRNREGRQIPLSAIASFNINKGFGQIGRENGKTFLAVKARTTVEDLPRLGRQIDELMKNFPLPVGYKWEKGERFRRFGQQGDTQKEALMISVVFVYLLMAILFESFILPLSIMLAIPLSFFGAFLALFITGTALDMMAFIGIIILVGVIVNNGIVLVDMINRQRWAGMSRREAILDAGQNRFRPIMMTSFTTICGLLPMALGSGQLIGIPYAPMGRALIGGMLTGTLLTLVVVPVFYTLFDDLAVFVQRVVGWYRRGEKRPQAGLTAPE